MKVTQHGRNLWQLTRMGMFNCYLVGEAGGLTLIDTGLRGSGKGIVQAAQTIGQPITRVTLTHAHGDHAGSLDEVSGLLPGVEVALAGRTAVAGIMRWSFPFPAMATWHLPTALDTAVALRTLNPTRLAVGHGPVLENPLAMMDAAIRVAEAKMHGQAQVA